MKGRRKRKIETREKNSSRGLLICWLPHIAAPNARPVVAPTAGSGTASSKVRSENPGPGRTHAAAASDEMRLRQLAEPAITSDLLLGPAEHRASLDRAATAKTVDRQQLEGMWLRASDRSARAYVVQH